MELSDLDLIESRIFVEEEKFRKAGVSYYLHCLMIGFNKKQLKASFITLADATDTFDTNGRIFIKA